MLIVSKNLYAPKICQRGINSYWASFILKIFLLRKLYDLSALLEVHGRFNDTRSYWATVCVCICISYTCMAGAFRRFSFFIRDVAHSPTALLNELRRIDGYLASAGHRFLRGDDHLDHLDCLLLPKLQHVRVAAKALRDFDIPTDMKALWHYLDNAYRCDPYSSVSLTLNFSHECLIVWYLGRLMFDYMHV